MTAKKYLYHHRCEQKLSHWPITQPLLVTRDQLGFIKRCDASFYWPNMALDTHECVRNCTRCAKKRISLRSHSQFPEVVSRGETTRVRSTRHPGLPDQNRARQSVLVGNFRPVFETDEINSTYVDLRVPGRSRFLRALGICVMPTELLTLGQGGTVHRQVLPACV